MKLRLVMGVTSQISVRTHLQRLGFHKLPDSLTTPAKTLESLGARLVEPQSCKKKIDHSQFPLLASQFSLLPLIIFRLWQHLAVETGVGSVPQLNLDLPYRGGPTRCAKIGRKV